MANKKEVYSKEDARMTLESHTKECLSLVENAVDLTLVSWGELGASNAIDIITEKHIVDTGNLRNSMTFKRATYEGNPAVEVGTPV